MHQGNLHYLQICENNDYYYSFVAKTLDYFSTHTHKVTKPNFICPLDQPTSISTFPRAGKTNLPLGPAPYSTRNIP